MNDWLKRQLADGLPAFAGSSVSGTIVVKQEIVNELLADLLLKTGGAEAASTTGDLSALAGVVKGVAVRAETGILMIDFRIAV